MTEKKLKGLFGGGEADGAAGARQASPDRAARRGGGGRRRRQHLRGIDPDRAQDFINRYTTGDPTEGFSSDEAVDYLRHLRGEVPPEVLQRAAVQTVQNLPPTQRQAFAEMLERRRQGTGMVTIERTGQAHATEGRGVPAGGGDAGMDDLLGGLFGSLFGGGMAQPAPQPMPRTQQAPGGFGADDMLGGLLGGLLGGAPPPQGRATQDTNPFDDLLGGLFGGGMGAPEPEPYQQPQPQQQPRGGSIGDILSSPLGKAVLGGIAAYAMKEMMEGNRGR